MIDRLLARLVVAAHAGYVVFVALGSLLVLRWPALIWVHVAAVVWAFLTLVFDMGCALTPWEKALWKRGGIEPYSEGFLQHHVLRTRFAAEHSRGIHIVLGALALILNLTVYAIFFLRR
jgi:Protein of Unknown function (DUF2784).